MPATRAARGTTDTREAQTFVSSDAHAGATPASPTSLQVRGLVSGAPARDAGEAGANPAHLTISLIERHYRIT